MVTYDYKGYNLVVNTASKFDSKVSVFYKNKVVFDTTSLDLAMKWVNSQKH